MKKFISSAARSVVMWFGLSLALAGVSWFLGNHVLTFEFTYRAAFWSTFFGGVVIFSLFGMLAAIPLPWMKNYVKYIASGMAPEKAYEKACENTTFQPPGWILRKMQNRRIVSIYYSVIMCK